MYVVRSSDEVDEQIAQLPHDGAARFAELRTALELDPWPGDPYVRGNPESSMRTRTFAAASGDGFVVYMVLERDRLIDLLQIVWLGRLTSSPDEAFEVACLAHEGRNPDLPGLTREGAVRALC